MTKSFEPRDPNFVARVRASFERQVVMSTLSASLENVEPGVVELAMPHDPAFTQQHGFLHAGIVTTLLDSACGYAAFSLMAAHVGVLTVEYKVNLLAPARGERFLARGEVKRPGRTLTVSTGDVFALCRGERTLVSSMQATIMAVEDREDVRG